ncbi:hypothetical protein ACFVFQ_09485 [Streptomyces sp. NPDC057743]|uniref:hypothetical protein n=1 Tax=Streptomyces sp. NPDC057743 TaxID=3346236 RepID=UPI0036B377AD
MSGTVGAGSRYGPGGQGEAEALLRARLRAADEEIEAPAGLWERVREPAAGRRGRVPAPRGGAPAPGLPRRRPYFVAAAAVVAVAAVVLGVWWLVWRPGAVDVRPAGPPTTVPLTVYNSEAACRAPHTLECALRLAEDPHRPYAAPGNTAGRVWHGQVLAARCVITDGQLVRDEQGITSSRWYRVRTAQGAQGWLPGVRTRNTREVPNCPTGGGG